MSDIAIKVENLSKSYIIRHQQEERYTALRDVITNGAVNLGKRLTGRGPAQDNGREEFWALNDVSFEIKQGERVGIIGRNGAGKSTLLKVLSRITEPTKGRVTLHGRVASLLEVGTGFHPELTGRENVYLNGAILGMTRREIVRKFDEIVDFAGVEKFLDTPVKRYSSGMYVRLAFAVAAHLEPEILVVDEVLAVGDAEFQKKCMGKMGEAAMEGRTVLFVSHNMQAISTLCERTILLNAGCVSMLGPTRQVVERYLEVKAEQRAEAIWDFEHASGTNVVKLHAVRALNSQGEIVHDCDLTEPIILDMEFWVLQPKSRLNPSFILYNSQGVCLFMTGNLHDPQWGQHHYEPGLYRSSCTIPGCYLNEGQHYVSVLIALNTSVQEVRMEEVVSFHIHDDGVTRGGAMGTWGGVVRPLLPWTARQIEELS